VLSRKVENSFLAWLLNQSKSSSISRVNIPFLSTDKNAQVFNFLSTYNFEKKDNNAGTEFSVDTSKSDVETVTFVKINA
jgi:predicted enzyme involved in methoxymalonyl-ACP biosynthesis